MGLARVEEKVFIIKKETVRGTAEAAAAGGRSLAVLPASEVNLNPNLLQNEKIFGDSQERTASAGPQEITGTLEMEPGADKIGELLLSLLGTVITDQPDVGGAPLVFRHRFTPGGVAQHPLYTLFVDRGAHQKKYGGLGVGQMTLNYPVDGRVAASVDVMAKTEAAGAVLTPDFSTDLEDLLFSDVSIDIAGVTSVKVRQMSVAINQNTTLKRILQTSRDPVDVVAGRLEVTGSLQLFFEDDVERDKFQAGTVTDLFILAQGQVLQAAEKATLSMDLPRAKYDAAPVGEVDGIQVLEMTFRAFFDPTATYQTQVTLINKVASY